MVDNEFMRRRAAQLMTVAGYLPDDSPEKAQLHHLGEKLCPSSAALFEQRLLDIVRTVPKYDWLSFVEGALDRLLDDANRLEDKPSVRAHIDWDAPP